MHKAISQIKNLAAIPYYISRNTRATAFKFFMEVAIAFLLRQGSLHAITQSSKQAIKPAQSVDVKLLFLFFYKKKILYAEKQI